MDRYLQKAARHKKWAIAEIFSGMGMMVISTLFACMIENPDPGIENCGFLAAICCLAIAGICIRAYYEDEEASKRWEKRSASHKELMYYSALYAAMEEANKKTSK